MTDHNRRSRYDHTANYVPALRDPAPPKTVYVDPTDLTVLPPAAQVQTEIRTSHVDRAKGFQIVSVPIAVAFGVGALVLAVVGWSIPAMSLIGLAVFWVAFLFWWLMAWVIHNVVSPDGIALIHTLMGWAYLRRDQRERHKRYRQQ